MREMPDEDPVSELEEDRIVIGIDIDGDNEPDVELSISGSDSFLKGYLTGTVVMTLVYAGIVYLV